MSNPKQRTARVSGSLLLGSNSYFDEAEEDLELTIRTQQVSNTPESGVEKLQSALYKLHWTPVGDVLFEIKDGSSSLVE